MWWRKTLPATLLYTIRQWRYFVQRRYLPVLNRSIASIEAQVNGIVALQRQHQVRMSSSDEVQKAQEAAVKAAEVSSEPTIFARIVNKEIPANIIHEDDKVSS